MKKNWPRSHNPTSHYPPVRSFDRAQVLAQRRLLRPTVAVAMIQQKFQMTTAFRAAAAAIQKKVADSKVEQTTAWQAPRSKQQGGGGRSQREERVRE